MNHFPSYQPPFELERELQTAAAGRFIEELLGSQRTHVVVAGDLDADPDAASIRFWTGRQSIGELSVCYLDAWGSTHQDAGGETFTTRNPLQTSPWWPFTRIDYIFIRCDERGRPSLRVKDCARVFDQSSDGIWGATTSACGRISSTNGTTPTNHRSLRRKSWVSRKRYLRYC